MMELRPYQKEAKQAIFDEWKRVDKTLLVCPTGCGKTAIFSKVAEKAVINGSRVLILAHRGELLEQARDKLYKFTGLRASLEKAESHSINEPYRITVGSVQTLMNEKRLEQFGSDWFDTIIVDEAHHCLAESYQRVLGYFSKAKVLGVTATPNRADFKNLGQYFETLAYEYTLPEAIRDGYLVPIQAMTIPLDIDLSNVAVQAGDFKASDIDSALDPYLYQIADEMMKYCADRKTVVFLPLVSTSQKFKDILNEKGFKAAEVNGSSDDRKQILKDFEDGRYNVLCNSMLLTEGWDCPSVDCVIVLRPTKSTALYQQMVGRGTRLYKGKDNLLILDFLWHTERHQLCHPASLICTSDDVAKKMTENFEENAGEAFDIEQAELQAVRDVQEERERAMAEELAKMRRRKRKLVDPLQYAMSISSEDLSNYVPSFGWENAPASSKQLQTLEKFGILPDTVENAGYASMLLDKLIKRKEAGLATPKQIRLLERYGFVHVGEWAFEDANKMISRISMNGWMVPYEVIPSEYHPKRISL